MDIKLQHLTSGRISEYFCCPNALGYISFVRCAVFFNFAFFLTLLFDLPLYSLKSNSKLSNKRLGQQNDKHVYLFCFNVTLIFETTKLEILLLDINILFFNVAPLLSAYLCLYLLELHLIFFRNHGRPKSRF